MRPKQLPLVSALSVGLYCGGACLSAWAQGVAAPPPSAAVSPAAVPAVGAPAVTAQEPDYRIAPDDVLSVNVADFPNFGAPQVVVTPDGNVSVPQLGTVHAAGKTTDELARLLTKRWQKFLVRPVVTVALTAKHRERVTVSGYVTHPGIVDYRPGLHVLNALAESGDVLPNGDLSKVEVTDPHGGRQTLDLTHPEKKSGTDLDLLLADGSGVYVPEMRDEFTVVGEVNKPGSYPYKSDMTVMDAVTAVGGVKDTADLNGARLTHGGQDTNLNLDALLRRGDMNYNFKLSPGDRLVIPQGIRTYVYGAVGHPGYYQYVPGDRLLDALNAAGGPIQGPDYSANLQKVNLVRISKGKDTAQVYPVDLDSFLKKGDINGNPHLQPGDVVYVQDKTKKQSFSWLGALQGLSLLSSGARVFTYGLGR